MSFRILIPAKPLADGKSRLAPVLESAARAALCERFLCSTVSLAADTAPTSVVTPDPLAAAIARSLGARALLEPFDCGLNAALDWARDKHDSADSLLVMPIDLPCLSPRSLQRFLNQQRIAIVTDRRGKGTNILFLPREVIRGFRFSFGQDSAVAHREEAERLGMPADMIDLAEAAFDIDLPDQYAEFVSRRGANGMYAKADSVYVTSAFDENQKARGRNATSCG